MKFPAGLKSFLRQACCMLTGHLHEKFSLQADGSVLPGLEIQRFEVREIIFGKLLPC